MDSILALLGLLVIVARLDDVGLREEKMYVSIDHARQGVRLGDQPIAQTIIFSSSVVRPHAELRCPLCDFVALKSWRRAAPSSFEGSSGFTELLVWKYMNSVTAGILSLRELNRLFPIK